MKKEYFPYAGAGIIVMLTLFSGYVQGRLSNRWGPTADMKAAAKRFDQIPRKFGSWEMVDEVPMEDRVTEMLELPENGYLNGKFVNQSTGETIDAFIILGPPGPVSVHTPEICYSSKDYDRSDERVAVKIGSGADAHEMWSITLRSNSVHKDRLRVYYGWGNADRWTAPYSPRFKFGGHGMLFKIQLAALLPPEASGESDDACKRFLEEYLPIITPILFTDAS
jgi:hypothetical protein